MEKQLLALVAAVAVLLVVATTTGHALAAARPAAGQTGLLCGMTPDGLQACEPAVSTKQLPSPPLPKCCKALAKADMSCLCDFKNKNPGLLKSINIDPKLATDLPLKCHLTPPSKC